MAEARAALGGLAGGVVAPRSTGHTRVDDVVAILLAPGVTSVGKRDVDEANWKPLAGARWALVPPGKAIFPEERARLSRSGPYVRSPAVVLLSTPPLAEALLSAGFARLHPAARRR